jgi:hypothetical protein
MKKYTLFVFILSFICFSFFSFNVNSAKANDSGAGCLAGDLFSRTTGQSCLPTEKNDCFSGDLFSSITGQSCNNTNVSTNNSSVVTQFNNLFKSYFRVGLRNDSNVRALQSFLKDEGYYFGRIDGSYGKITARAVRDFRDDYDLTNAPTPPTPTTTDTSIPIVRLSSYKIGAGDPSNYLLSWDTSNATYCQYVDPVSGVRGERLPTTGTKTVSIDQTTNFRIWCSGSGGTAYSNVVTLTVDTTPTSTLSITTSSQLPNATVGVPYSATFNATGGNGSYSWRLLSTNVFYGSVFSNMHWPSGCASYSCGPFTGTPTQAGTYTFSLQVTSGSQSVSLQFTLQVDPVDTTTTVPLTITTSSQLPNAKAGQPYSVTLDTSGGAGPAHGYSWKVNNGATAFPVSGLGISSSFGHPIYITGTPADVYVAGVKQTTSQTFTFNVTASDGYQTTTKQFTLTVDPASISCSSQAFDSVTGNPLPCGCTSTSGFSNIDGSACGPSSTTTSAPIITIFSPNGGDSWQIGNTYNIQWNVSGQLATRTVHLVGTINGVGVDKYLGSTDGNQLSYTVNSQVSPVGSYTLQVCGAYCSGISSSPVQINVTASPTISVLTPSSVTAGSTITVYGTNFDSSSWVSIGGAPGAAGTKHVTPSSYTSTSLSFIVPSDMGAGIFQLLVANRLSTGDIPSNLLQFTVIALTTTSIPTVTSVYPILATVGSTVYVNGTNFDSTSYVTFDGVQVTTATNNYANGQLYFTVPSFASSGGMHSIRVSKTGFTGLSNFVELSTY